VVADVAGIGIVSAALAPKRLPIGLAGDAVVFWGADVLGGANRLVDDGAGGSCDVAKPLKGEAFVLAVPKPLKGDDVVVFTLEVDDAVLPLILEPSAGFAGLEALLAPPKSKLAVAVVEPNNGAGLDVAVSVLEVEAAPNPVNGGNAVCEVVASAVFSAVCPKLNFGAAAGVASLLIAPKGFAAGCAAFPDIVPNTLAVGAAFSPVPFFSGEAGGEIIMSLSEAFTEDVPFVLLVCPKEPNGVLLLPVPNVPGVVLDGAGVAAKVKPWLLCVAAGWLAAKGLFPAPAPPKVKPLELAAMLPPNMPPEGAGACDDAPKLPKAGAEDVLLLPNAGVLELLLPNMGVEFVLLPNAGVLAPKLKPVFGCCCPELLLLSPLAPPNGLPIAENEIFGIVEPNEDLLGDAVLLVFIAAILIKIVLAIVHYC